MGVGIIIGTTICIYECGPSSLFWMIIFFIVSLPITYYEASLGYKYRKKINDNYISGPPYYMKNKCIKKIYIYLFLLTYSCLFLMVQTNVISNIIDINIYVNKYILVVFFSLLLTYLLIIDLKSIISIMNKLVIFMCMFIVFILMFVFVKNIYLVNGIITLVVNDIFNYKSIILGLFAFVLVFKRCFFQTELLVGTTSISSSLSNSSLESTSRITVLSSYFIFIISILFSYMILVYKIDNLVDYKSYFHLINNVFIYHFGDIGSFILIILFLILSLTTIIGAYYFGINNIKMYNKYLLFPLKALMLLFPLCGILISSNIVWEIVDIFMVILMILNFIEMRRLI